MANRKIEIMHLKELLQLKAKGYSNRRIGEALGISRNTVNEYVQLFSKSGQRFEELSRWSLGQIKKLEEELSAKPEPAVNSKYEQLRQAAPAYLQELKRPGCTYQQLWYPYKEAHPEGYGFTRLPENGQCFYLLPWWRQHEEVVVWFFQVRHGIKIGPLSCKNLPDRQPAAPAYLWFPHCKTCRIFDQNPLFDFADGYFRGMHRRRLRHQ